MKSKAAANAVLSRRTPCYIPLGTYAIDCDTAEKVIGHETYVRNKVKTQLALWEGRRDEVAQSLREDAVELFKRLDCIDVIIPFKEAAILPPASYMPEKVKRIGDNTWESDNGTVYCSSESTNDITVVKRPDVQDRSIYDREPRLEGPDESIFEAYDYLVDQLSGERFLLGLSGGFEPMVLPGGMEKGLMEYCLNPEGIHAMNIYNVKLHNFLDQYHIRKGVDQIFIECDFATSTAPLISPGMFREFCLPVMKARIENIKKFRDKVFLHSCGNNWKLMDMIVEAGVDGYQSLQTGAGMDLKLLKEAYGDKLCFWGGVGVETLIDGTAEEVRMEVRTAMEKGAGKGGFILGPSHSIAYGVKYDNFMAMLDEHDKLKFHI